MKKPEDVKIARAWYLTGPPDVDHYLKPDEYLLTDYVNCYLFAIFHPISENRLLLIDMLVQDLIIE